jgi:uncharacterized protein (DUF1330 family)
MSKAYVVIQFNLINQELFGKYVRATLPLILASGGQVMVAAENLSPLEGSMPSARTTVIEFPSREAAETWYNSNEYNAVKHLRHEATTNGSLVILDAWKKPAGMP